MNKLPGIENLAKFVRLATLNSHVLGSLRVLTLQIFVYAGEYKVDYLPIFIGEEIILSNEFLIKSGDEISQFLAF